mgnify:FL=1
MFLAIFGKKNGQQIIGGKVLAGNFKKNLNVNIKKGEQIIGKGKIINLQSNKKDINQVNENEECGMLLETKCAINAGDILAY